MLFFLTGDIQTGKTRWTERLLSELDVRGATAYGVVAPGVWRPVAGGAASWSGVSAARYEKLGIDNVLLPSRERVHLARRRDLALAEGLLEPDGQSERAGLGWAMSDAVLAQVNRHFEALSCERDTPASCPGLLVVDELGRLELLRGEGLTWAVSLLSEGPCVRWSHALVIVRKDLLPAAHVLLDAIWGEVCDTLPTTEAHKLVLDTVLGAFDA